MMTGQPVSLEAKTESVKPITYDFDVIVIGGEPEGVAASVSAARNGAKTLLVEHRDGLGGLLTYGYLNQLDLGYDKDKRLANQGIFAEWFKMIGRQGNFDIELGKRKFHELVTKEKNITLLLNTTVKEIKKEKNKVVGVVLSTPKGERTYYAKRFIDTTAEADFAAKAGVPYFLGQEDMGLKDRQMAVTLVILLKNVDWEAMKKSARSGVLGGAKVGRGIAWGFAEVPNVYKPSEENTRVRGLNLGIQSNGIVTINALQIFGVDGTDPASIEEGIERGKRETQSFLTFLQKELPGFEKAEIAGYPTELYIRETRHIKAEYQLSIVDVWENKDQWDSIGLGAYPVDVQATDPSGFGVVVTAPIQYAIPFRSLVPLQVENLLVASKASGYTSLAAGSARTVPIGMTAAEAAGAAAVLSIEKNRSFRALSKDREAIKELQSILKAQGAHLYSFSLSYPYKGEWFYPAVRSLLPYGLLAGGYNNNLQVKQAMHQREFLRLLSGLVIRKDAEKYKGLSRNMNPWTESVQLDTRATNITRDQAAEYYLRFFGYPADSNVWQEAQKHQLVDTTIVKRVPTNRDLTRAEIFHMTAHLLKLLNEGRFEHAYDLGNPKVGYIDVYNGRTMVPTRFVSEQLGAQVEWDKDSNIIEVDNKKNKMLLKVHSKKAVINGQQIELDAAPTIAQGVSYIPIRAVADALEAKVVYIKEKKVVQITLEDKLVEIPVRKK